MVGDLVPPKYGGVETHIFFLSQCLIDRGHKITGLGNYFLSARTGVRNYPNGMKFYYLPHKPWIASVISFFTLW